MLSFVLRRNDWREFDQIITLYTFESGRVEVLARGVKKILSKNSSFLEPGSLIEAEIIPGKELNHLGSVQPIQVFVNLVNNNILTFSLGVFLNFITHQERDERVFKMLYGWINFLNQEKNIPVIFSLDIFVVKFLRVLGFDITQEGKVGLEIRKDLEIVDKGGWKIVNQLKFEGSEGKILHDIIYQFCLYHAPKKVDDWAKLAYFSGKC